MRKIVTLFALTFVIMFSSSFFAACEVEPVANVGAFSMNEESFDGKTFPFVYVDVENNAQITSKEDYLNCTVKITNTTEDYLLDTCGAKIKGRGNSTWELPKKPYKLKFNSKTNLFGFGKAKNYTLIANYSDKSLSRNLMAYEVAKLFGLNETSSAQPVNLILNGQFNGVYLLCEQNEIGEHRVNVESNLANVDTGYLVELDAMAVDEGVEGEDYFKIDELCYAIKDPETDDADFTEDHFNFIKNYMQDCFSAICANDYDEVKNLVDVNSFAKCYIVHEMFNCVDVGYSSFYFYKNAGSKLFAGPLWDFDLSSGNCNFVEGANDTDYLYAKESNIWYKELLEFEQFQTLVKNLISEYKDSLLDKIQEVVDYQIGYVENNEANFVVWNILNSYVWPNPTEIVNIKTFEGQVYYLQDWLEQKLNYMAECYS